MPIGNIKIEEAFTYHPPTEEQVAQYAALRSAYKDLAYKLDALVPDSPDKSAAFRLLRESCMTANAAIACKGTL